MFIATAYCGSPQWMFRANLVCTISSGGREELTFLPASLLCRFIAALASCPVSRASTNCLEMASPKPTLSLQPPHSQPCPPKKGDEIHAVKQLEEVSEVMGGNEGCGANPTFHFTVLPHSLLLDSWHFYWGLDSMWLRHTAKGYALSYKFRAFQTFYRPGFRSCQLSCISRHEISLWFSNHLSNPDFS